MEEISFRDSENSYRQLRLQELKQLYPVTEQGVLGYLRGTSFRQVLATMMKRSTEMEQGMVIGYTPDPKRRIHVVWDKAIGPASTAPDGDEIEKRRLLPFLRLHAHPISETVGQFVDYAPSDDDLTNGRIRANFLEKGRNFPINWNDGLLVQGARPTAWLWDSVSAAQNRIQVIYRDWLGRFSGPVYNYGEFRLRVPTYRDLDELQEDLRGIGVHINQRELDRSNLTGSLADFVESMHFKYGFKE